MSDYLKAQGALSFIDSDDRDIWIRMGMALKSEFGDEAFDLWDKWSQGSASYKSKDAVSSWKSFHRGGGTTMASLYYHARSNGWRDEKAEPLSPEEINTQNRKRFEARKKREEEDEKARIEKLRMQKIASDKTQALLDNAQSIEHPYLKSKQLPEVMGFVQGDVLVIPLRSLEGDLTGSQLIWWHDAGAGTTDIHVQGHKPISFKDMEDEPEGFIKKFIPGTYAKGSVFRIGNRYAPMTILCEGYATGLSISKAAHLMRLDVSVLVCFSAFNTFYVSSLLKGKNRGIFADHDISGKGEEYAKKAGVRYIKSKHEGFDANDEMVEMGIFYLCENIRQLTNSMK